LEEATLPVDQRRASGRYDILAIFRTRLKVLHFATPVPLLILEFAQLWIPPTEVTAFMKIARATQRLEALRKAKREPGEAGEGRAVLKRPDTY
jgi:hypothetical protein